MEDVRCRRPDRDQMLLEPVDLDGLLPAGHTARVVWEVTGKFDLSAFFEAIKARGENAGRSATDPRLLLALWLYATIEGIGSGRELARLCRDHDAYRWLRGGVSVNYHTLNDFRVAHEKALDALLTQILTALVSTDTVQVKRISQDGTRVRASAGRKSFRRRYRLTVLRDEVAAYIEELKREGMQDTSQSTREQHDAEERLSRIDEALAAVKALESAKSEQKEKPSKHRAARASTTDADARMMRMGDGGHAPAYNVQFAVDTESRAIVGVDVTNQGSDANESGPMRSQVESRTGQQVEEHLMDGGFVNLRAIESAEASGVRIYAPVPKPKRPGTSRYWHRSTDGPGVRGWRSRMRQRVSQAIYRQRAASVETVNADVKQHRGLRQFPVRGLQKVRCVTLLVALSYNLIHFGSQLLA